MTVTTETMRAMPVVEATARAVPVRAGDGRAGGDATGGAAVTPRRPALAEALLVVESLLLGGGQRTARRNAWSSVVADRQRARERAEAQRVLGGASVFRP